MYHASLIVGHFLFSAVLVLSVGWWPVDLGRLVIGLPGIVLAIWAWCRVGIHRLRLQPSVSQETEFVQSGPFAFVRHPMYAGLLWFTAAIVLFDFTWWRAAVWIALLVDLHVKALEEERSMLDRFPSYSHYQQKVRKLLPLPK